MKKLNTLIWKLRIMRDTRGQDLIEYALMAGFVAVAAGAIAVAIRPRTLPTCPCTTFFSIKLQPSGICRIIFITENHRQITLPIQRRACAFSARYMKNNSRASCRRSPISCLAS